MTQWCLNGATGEIFSYQSCGELTDFPRGTFLAYGDALMTGFETRGDAELWRQEWVYKQTGRRASEGTWEKKEQVQP